MINRICFLMFLMGDFLFISKTCYGSSSVAQNLSCYQCLRTEDVECEARDLKPCRKTADRCVTTVQKNAQDGLFEIKRECGLFPCNFNEINIGGGFDKCDRTKDDYFCIFCCKESGCNKNNGTSKYLVMPLTITFYCLIFVFCYLYLNTVS